MYYEPQDRLVLIQWHKHLPYWSGNPIDCNGPLTETEAKELAEIYVNDNRVKKIVIRHHVNCG